MSDLAAIYGKIGKYRKEAQVYEEMQKTGTTSPDLAQIDGQKYPADQPAKCVYCRI